MGQAGLLHGIFQRLQPVDGGLQPIHQHGVVRSVADSLQCGDHLVDLGNDLFVGNILGRGQIHAVEHILQIGEDGIGGVQHLQQVVGGVVRRLDPGVNELHGAADGGRGAVHGALRVADGDGGGSQQAAGALHHILQRAEHLRHLIHILLGGGQLLQQVIGNVLPVKSHGLEHRTGGSQGIGHLLQNGGVDLLLHGGFGLAGDLGGNGVLFLVLVILDLRMVQVALQNADKVAGKLRRQDQRGVVVAGVHAVQRCLGIVHKDPAHLIVGLQPLQHQLADVQVESQYLVAVVLAGYRHLDTAGGGRAVGVPVGQNVEPRIEAGHQTQAQHDHHRHHAGSQALPIGAENTPDISHLSTSSCCAAARRRSSDSPCSAQVSSSRSPASFCGSRSSPSSSCALPAAPPCGIFCAFCAFCVS